MKINDFKLIIEIVERSFNMGIGHGDRPNDGQGLCKTNVRSW
jgi:hypothetical protein